MALTGDSNTDDGIITKSSSIHLSVSHQSSPVPEPILKYINKVSWPANEDWQRSSSLRLMCTCIG